MGSVTSSQLRVKIKSELGESRHDLSIGRPLVIGRGPMAGAPLIDPSVSVEHLEITWTGFGVNVRDLKSSNGTFRLPQDSPFVESSFASRLDDLRLRLGKVIVTLAWQPIATSEMTDSVPLVNAAMPGPTDASPPMPVREIRGVDEGELGRWVIFLGVQIFLWIAAMLLNRYLLDGIASASHDKLAHGGAYDGLIEWMRILRDDSTEVIVASGVYGVFMAGIWDRLRRSRTSFLEYLGRTVKSVFPVPLLLWKFAALILAVVVLFWPVVWAMSYGVSLSSLSRLQKLSDLVVGEGPQDLAKRSEALKGLNESFHGSSFLYKRLFETQTKRILTECGGVGDQPWDRKKLCLGLLVAVGIETYQTVQPALLQDIATRAAMLLSLDGITRVAAVDGISSPQIPAFLNLLENIGMKQEQSDIERILYNPAKRAPEIVAELRDLRRQLEHRIDVRARELRLPVDLILAVPGPLESGI